MPPYPRKLINEGESVVLDLKPHWFFFWKHIVAGTVLLVVFFLWIGPFGATSWVGWPLALALLIWAGFVVEKYLVWTYTHFVLTDRRVISRSGIVSKRGTEIPLERVNNIDFHQNIFLRMIGAGDLDIESAGRDGQSHFDNVRHPDMVQQEIYRQMEANARRQASWSGQAAADAGLGRADRGAGPRRARHHRPDREAGGTARPGAHHARGVRSEEGPAARADVRVVSLVPSATETLRALGVTPVACTRFCEQPDLETVGGTKDPQVDAIVALAPDLVVVNDEENRREDADALVAAGPDVAFDVAAIRGRGRRGGPRSRRRGRCERAVAVPGGGVGGLARRDGLRRRRGAGRGADLAAAVDHDARRHLRIVGAPPPRLGQRVRGRRRTGIQK